MSKRIGIDARFFGPEGTGIGRYLEKLLENLEVLDTENEYFVFLRKSNFPLYNPKNPNFTKIMADAHWYSLKEQVIMPQVLLKEKLDLVHFPQVNIPLLYPKKFVVTLHDLTKINFKDKAATTRALPIYLAKHSIQKPYLLYLGNAYHYKNLGRLIEALADVDPGVKLVCVTKRDAFLERLLAQAENVGIRNRLIITGWVGDEDLKILFNQAEALVFPSLSEGFGLPGLEAMALSCPVVAANATSLPEVYEDAALFFDPNSTGDIAKKINEVLGSQRLRLDLIKKGREQVKKYSWKKMAQETLKIYQRIIDSGH